MFSHPARIKYQDTLFIIEGREVFSLFIMYTLFQQSLAPTLIKQSYINAFGCIQE